MKKIVCLFACLFVGSVNASTITANFSFDNIASGSFSYDASLDGTLIDYTELNSFQLDFSGLTNTSYDLAFVLSGNSAWHFFEFDSSIDSFLSQNISGFPTTLADIKNSFDQGFFVRDDLQIIRDYVGDSDQFYQNLSISVDRSASVPEPSAIALFGLGLAGLGFSRKKKSA